MPFPMGFCPGSLIQPELMVIVIGACFAELTHQEHEEALLEGVEECMGGVWVFGQLVLFMMLGSKTDPTSFVFFPDVLPILLLGLVFRFIGVLLAMFSTLWCRQCSCNACRTQDESSLLPDSIYYFLSTLPRATIQGALGPVPLMQNFFVDENNRCHAVQVFIANAARLYIVTLGILGSVLLDGLGPRMLRRSEREKECEAGDESQEQDIDFRAQTTDAQFTAMDSKTKMQRRLSYGLEMPISDQRTESREQIVSSHFTNSTDELPRVKRRHKAMTTVHQFEVATTTDEDDGLWGI